MGNYQMKKSCGLHTVKLHLINLTFMADAK